MTDFMDAARDNRLTFPQFQKLSVLWRRQQNADTVSADVRGESFGAFLNRAGYGTDYIGVLWLGMFIGIERDGYSHS